MKKAIPPILPLLAFCLAVFARAWGGEPSREGRVVIRYWEKWTGFEAEAMRRIVGDYNASQEKVFVEYSSVSQMDRRLMLATAGGVPPDVAGIWSYLIPIYAENNALTPLGRRAAEAGVGERDYLPSVWRTCNYRGRLWGLPSTPASIGLVWNKKLFREAGLDPERPPRTIAELEEFNGRLAKRDASGRLVALGHLPEEPGWWNAMWGYWFGGELWDGASRVTTDSPENLAAYRWVASYPERFGVRDLLAFRDGFGNFASPQNPFFTGRVAMVLQGVWIHNYIENYAPPGFEWGVAAFPSAGPGAGGPVSVVECDILVIPAGAKHPDEAFAFIRYVNSRGPMEKLCLEQKKFSPLAECSPEFFAAHPHPRIREFLDLAKSPGARSTPPLPIWNEYASDMKSAVSKIWSGGASPEEALAEVRVRQQKAFDKKRARWRRVEAKLEERWEGQ